MGACIVNTGSGLVPAISSSVDGAGKRDKLLLRIGWNLVQLVLVMFGKPETAQVAVTETKRRMK